MKQFLLGLILTIGFFFLAKPVLANEGVFHLVGPSEEGGACFAASVYVDGSYRVLLTCRGLKMALDPVRNKYVVWADTGIKKIRLGEIVNGKLSANVQEEFSTLFVTLEPDAYGAKPTGLTALTGSVEAIDFGKVALGAALTPAATLTITPTATGQAPAVTPAAAGRLTSVVVGIGKAILFGFILLLIIVGVMSFLARRKNL